MKDLSIIPLFSKVLFTTILSLTDKQKKDIISIMENESFRSANNNSEISLNLNILKSNKLKFLKKEIMSCFNNFVNDTLSFKNNKFKITNSWITKVGQNNLGHSHNHGNSFYSGVFYIDVNENSGKITFINVNKSAFELKPNEYNNLNSPKWSIQPKNNQVIFFPSEVYHQVEENKSNTIRYSLAFNIMPIGKIGVEDSNMNIKIYE